MYVDAAHKADYLDFQGELWNTEYLSRSCLLSNSQPHIEAPVRKDSAASAWSYYYFADTTAKSL